MFQSINPYSGEIFAEYPYLDNSALRNCVTQAENCFLKNRSTSYNYRAALMSDVAELMIQKREELAGLITSEMGKPINQAKAEIDKCISTIQYLITVGKKTNQSTLIEGNWKKAEIRYEPLGVLVAIMPWNFPFWQVLRFAVPAILAGNVVLLKHAPNVPGSAIALQKLFLEAGFPEYTLTNLFISTEQTARLIESPTVKGVTLTGSVEAGRKVASNSAFYLKKTVLELGGSDAFIVLKDANIQAAAETAVRARLQNNGQTCVAAKRFIIEAPVYDDFCHFAIDAIRRVKAGNPMLETTTLGPLARKDLWDKLNDQTSRSIEKGASIMFQYQLEEKGLLFPPTLLTNIEKDIPAYHEELFGPVAGVFSVADEQKAVQLANDTVFGLGAALWSADEEKVESLIPQLEAGAVAINSYVVSDPRLPFGGTKNSGFGRELGEYGFKEFVNIKSVIYQ